ncbi:PFL family protein [Rothia sp. P13129]|uniref:PFL family protein n=1 Tax=unclassified Rothia (in: high G+C Gram-positive bacteria) TaxID=2689056 RepID=UPI003ACF2689
MVFDRNANILETLQMIEEDKLDIRTVTMGISLLDCADAQAEVACQKIYQKITQRAQKLVEVVEGIEAELGIPIINKRISVTPISLVAGASDATDYVEYAKALDAAAKATGVDFIGGFSALVDKGMTPADSRLLESIPRALNETDVVCASVNIGSSRAGINMSAVAKMGEVIRQTAEGSAHKHGFACSKLVVFANAVSDNPFMAGAFHGVQEADTVISVGVSGPGVVKRALERVRGESFDACAEAVKKAAFKITRVGQLVGNLAAERLGVQFGIVDLSLAPTAEVGDSVAHILEEMGLESVGTHGTIAALALVNDAVKKGGMMACSHVGGLSGSFIPVSEDIGMIEAAAAQKITLDKLEAMTAICSVGLDMVAIPGDTSASTIAAMIADEAAIGVMNHKTTAVRVIPAIGLEVGQMVEFGGLLGRAPVMPIHAESSELFAARGGRIPSPVHGFRN